MPLAAAAPAVTPDLSLPSPCNLGAMVALASSSDRLSPDLLNARDSDRGRLVDYKCAGNARPPGPADTPPVMPPTGK
jgi:hypothetical protein